MKAIVLYCSLSGNTEKIARRIARDFQCDILKIEPDVVYGGFASAVVRVMRDRIRGDVPGSVTETPDLSAYDTVFIGFPIWYNSVPEFAQEFLMRCDLNGKRVFPFATSSASYITGAVNCLANICTGAEILKPFTYSVRHRDNFSDWELDVTEACEEEEELEDAADAAEAPDGAEAVDAADAPDSAEAFGGTEAVSAADTSDGAAASGAADASDGSETAGAAESRSGGENA